MFGASTTANKTIQWGRILLGAFLLEAALFAVLIPIGLTFGMPSAPGSTDQPVDATIFFVSVPLACLVLGFLFGMWVTRKGSSQFALHGALLGIIATTIYLGICAIPPSTIPSVVAMYGAPLFVATNALRIVGCVAGAWLAHS